MTDKIIKINLNDLVEMTELAIFFRDNWQETEYKEKYKELLAKAQEVNEENWIVLVEIITLLVNRRKNLTIKEEIEILKLFNIEVVKRRKVNHEK